jgi:hypothetical protein
MIPESLFQGPPNARKWRELGQYLRSQRISGGPGVLISQGPSGTTIRTKQVFSGTGGTSRSPFEPVIGKNGDNWEVRITSGILWKDGEEVSITSVGSVLPVSAENHIYLEAEIGSDLAVTSVTAKAGAAWEAYPAQIVFSASSPFPQAKAFVSLGEVIANEEDADQLEIKGAWQSGHIRLARVIDSGRIARAFRPGN